MKKKPHGLFYLIPVGLLLVGLGLGVYFFYQAVMAPLQNIQEITMNRENDLVLSEGSFISLYINDDELEAYEILQNDGIYLLHYKSKNDFYLIEIEIVNLGNTENPMSGFYISEIEENSTYTFDDYLNYGDIKVIEDSTYRVRLISYDDLPSSFGFAYSDYNDASAKLLTSVLGISIGTGGAIISFTVLMILRAKANKEQKETTEENESHE